MYWISTTINGISSSTRDRMRSQQIDFDALLILDDDDFAELGISPEVREVSNNKASLMRSAIRFITIGGGRAGNTA